MVPAKKQISKTSVTGIPGVLVLILSGMLRNLDLGFDTEMIQLIADVLAGGLLVAWAKFTADDKKEKIIDSMNKVSSDNGQ